MCVCVRVRVCDVRDVTVYNIVSTPLIFYLIIRKVSIMFDVTVSAKSSPNGINNDDNDIIHYIRVFTLLLIGSRNICIVLCNQNTWSSIGKFVARMC